MNPFDIGVPCVNIEKSELLFEQYRMALNWYKYDIEVQNYDAINRNRILFDFMQRKFKYLDGLYSREKRLLMDTIIMINQGSRVQRKLKKLNREKNSRNKRKEGTSDPSPKKACFVNKTTRTSLATINTSDSNFITNIPQWSEASSSKE